MRIYEQFEKSLSAKENADFLKNEYGWGGSYPVIIGAGIDESTMEKVLRLRKASVKKIHISHFRGRRWRSVSGNLSEWTDT